MRWRTLLALLVAVLLVHWTVLTGQLNNWVPTASSGRTMSTRTVEAPAPAPTAVPAVPPAPAPAPKVPPVPKVVSAAPKKVQNKPVVQVFTAQAAIENIAKPSPPTPSESPTEKPEAPQTTAPDTTASTPSSTATESSLDQQLASAQPLREAAAQSAAQEFAFPASGSFAFNAVQTRGAQTQSAFGNLEWASDGRRYQLQLEAKAFAVSMFRRTSTGRLGASGLQPERFSDKRFNRSEQAAHFQTDKGIISFANNKPSAPLLSGAQDQLSMMLQLAGIVGGNPAQVQSQGSVQLQVAGTDEADLWVFSVEGMETIVLPAGTTTALHLLRAPRKEFDRRVELWLAPTLNYMPVRFKQTEQNGDTLDLLLRSPNVRMPEPAANCAASKTC
jgi:outer membrane biosynthesis protein TonB